MHIPQKIAETRMEFELGIAWLTVSTCTIRVSTVYKGYGSPDKEGESLAYETMVFSGKPGSEYMADLFQREYSSKEQALVGHRAIVSALLHIIGTSLTFDEILQKIRQADDVLAE